MVKWGPLTFDDDIILIQYRKINRCSLKHRKSSCAYSYGPKAECTRTMCALLWNITTLKEIFCWLHIKPKLLFLSYRNYGVNIYKHNHHVYYSITVVFTLDVKLLRQISDAHV